MHFSFIFFFLGETNWDVDLPNYYFFCIMSMNLVYELALNFMVSFQIKNLVNSSGNLLTSSCFYLDLLRKCRLASVRMKQPKLILLWNEQ